MKHLEEVLISIWKNQKWEKERLYRNKQWQGKRRKELRRAIDRSKCKIEVIGRAGTNINQQLQKSHSTHIGTNRNTISYAYQTVKETAIKKALHINSKGKNIVIIYDIVKAAGMGIVGERTF